MSARYPLIAATSNIRWKGSYCGTITCAGVRVFCEPTSRSRSNIKSNTSTRLYDHTSLAGSQRITSGRTSIQGGRDWIGRHRDTNFIRVPLSPQRVAILLELVVPLDLVKVACALMHAALEPGRWHEERQAGRREEPDQWPSHQNEVWSPAWPNERRVP